MRVGTFSDRVEWLRWRHKRIGASDAPTVMGINPHRTRQELFEEHTTGAKASFASAAMAEGHRRESELLEKLAGAIGAEGLEAQVCFESDIHTGLIATTDGVAYVGGELVVLETKIRHTGCWETMRKNNRLPLDIRMQVMQQMHCSGASRGYVLVGETWDNWDDTLLFEVPWDEALWGEIFLQEMLFFEAIEHQTELPHYMYLEDPTMDAFHAICEKYAQLQPTREELAREYEREELAKQLREYAMREQQTLAHDRVVVKFGKRKGAIDYARMTEELSIDVSDYRKPDTSTVRIEIK